MNKDDIKGKANDIKGRVKRQAGEWTGDEKLQGEGAMDQAKGKAQNAWGKVKDSAHDLKEEVAASDADPRPRKDEAASSLRPNHGREANRLVGSIFYLYY